MKEWKKPFVKWVILKNVDIVTASTDSSQRGVSGDGFQNEGESWIDSSTRQ